MIFSRAWFALMRRNFVFRRRNWLGSLLEILLPMGFVGVLVGIKSAVDDSEGFFSGTVPAFFPSDAFAFTPLTARDYFTFMQAKRTCIKGNEGDLEFVISGIEKNGYNWQVPLVKCDSTLCEREGQDASQFCEYGSIALAPSSPEDEGGKRRALEFEDWIYWKYPELVGLLPFDVVQHFDSPQAMDAYVTAVDYEGFDTPKIAMGIVWEGDDPMKYYYALRQNSTNFNAPESASRPATSTTPDTKRLFHRYARNDFGTCTPTENTPRQGPLELSCTGQYVYNGVLTFQRLVGDFILNQTGAADAGYKVAEAGVRFVQFPIKEYEDSGFYSTIAETGPLLVTLGMLYPVAAMIGYIVREKELRQKELMKMMSVTESDIGWSWFVTFLLWNIVAAFFTTVMSNVLYEASEFRYLFQFWVLTFLAVTVFSMMISSFSSKSARAVLFGLLAFFIGVFLTISIPIDYTRDDGTLVGLISLHPVAAFSYGLQEIGRLEDKGLGLQSGSMGQSDNESGFNFNDALGYLIFDSIFWGVITWYLNRTIEPDYGQALPLWFPFTLSYWFPSRATSRPTTKNAEKDEDETSSIPQEPVSDTLRRQADEGKSIELRSLRKVFGDKVAVDGLNLSMYNGQITALLGHNGAGKTTTVNILTGATAPTSGYAIVGGKDIRYDMSRIRQDIGICMQHDCLFPQLTVREHIQFFARLKGLYQDKLYEDAEADVTQAIQDVALLEKSNTLSKNLSGGMKRKLSVAIAFCGGSSIVLLDEPTSGMDPFSRRFTWNVIRHYRQNRCIILTTHFMDEADILGDRIAIMAEGQLRCAGSSLFLKKTYGVGYQLTIEKSKAANINNVEGGEDAMREDAKKHNSGEELDNSEEPGHTEEVDDSIEKLGTNAGRGSADQSHATWSLPKTCFEIGGHSLLTALQLNDSIEEEAPTIHDRDGDASVDSERINKTPSNDCVLSPILGKISLEELLKTMVSYSVPSSVLLSDVGSEISFQLPIGASSHFLPMFERLDKLLDKGLIGSYGLSITTLDAVFLLVARHNSGTKSVPAPLSNRDASDITSTPKLDKRSARSRMDLEQDGLFFRHMGALFKKRAGFFRRDRKAWLCTTILPSICVCLGFVLFNYVALDRNMDPLTLDLNEYNLGQSPPRNPIPFNLPGSFSCQPGICTYRPDDEPVISANNETYFYCGYQGSLEQNQKCSIQDSESIVEKITTAGASAEGTNVTSVSQSSRSLYNTSVSYGSSQFGALFFTHDRASVLDDFQNSLYSDAVDEACRSRIGNFTSAENCDDYQGIGYVVQYNYTALHVSPLYQSLADEALVRQALDSPDFEILCTIAPLPITSKESKYGRSEDAFSAWFLVVLSFPFISGAFASFIVAERESKAKHLQTVAGVQPIAYWLSTFCWDVLNYQIPMWITVILMFAFNVDVLTTSQRDVFSGILAVLLLYGPAAAGFTYCITFAFSSASLCNMFVILAGFLIGMGGPLACFILLLLGINPLDPKPHLIDVANIIQWILRFNPSFCLGNAIFKCINIELFAFLAGDYNLSVWTKQVMLYEIIFLAAQTMGYMSLAIQLDRWSTNPRALSIWQSFLKIITFQFINHKGSNRSIEIATLPDDDDVLKEQNRVLSAQANDDLLVVSELTKIYDTGKKAVDKLSIGIPAGECFGLLGINGAGKTTTLSILTAEFPPTSGDAAIAGFSVTKEPQKTRRRIGYCPQFDAHFANLTGREHVELYASVKGVPRELVKEAVAAKLAEVGLSETDSDRLTSGYSGGMKRRLSLACATIGQPQVVFLDECSTGVDPVARREIWQMINNMVYSGDLPPEERTSVILTTHSMEECEALCPRIGIMAAGRLRCLGSAQHLKNKFGQGFQVEMKVCIADHGDDDFISAFSTLSSRSNEQGQANGDADPETAEPLSDSEFCYLNLDESIERLRKLTGDESISALLNGTDPYGYPVWKDATSVVGVSLESLTAFATNELRVLSLQNFMKERFPGSTLRERQDMKMRYEVKSDGTRISKIFACIEENKEILRLADYGVSQTSLEQVFNTHAAEAEKLKEGHYDD